MTFALYCLVMTIAMTLAAVVTVHQRGQQSRVTYRHVNGTQHRRASNRAIYR